MKRVLAAFEGIRNKNMRGFLRDAYNLSIHLKRHGKTWEDVRVYLKESAESKDKKQLEYQESLTDLTIALALRVKFLRNARVACAVPTCPCRGIR